MRAMKKLLSIMCLTMILTLGMPIVMPSSDGIMTVEAATKVKLNKTKATIYVGKSVQLKIKGTKGKVKWSSNKKSVAKVSSKGKVTGKKAGKAVITAKVGKKRYKCNITVKKKNNSKSQTVDVESISLNQTEMQLNEGENATLVATVIPYNATNKVVSWSSSDTSVATVNNGVVTGISAGNAFITATVGNNSASCRVVVKKQEIVYVGDRSVQYDSESVLYRIFFSLLLEDGVTRVSSSGFANIKIVNDNGTEVYNKSIGFSERDFAYWTSPILGRKYMCCIEVPISDIEKGKVSTGILSYDVTLSDGSFPEKSYNIKDLPVLDPNELCKVIPPEPDVVAYYHTLSGNLSTMCMVSGAECNVTSNGRGGFNLEVILSGSKIYDSDGEKSDSPCRFRLKLYKDNQVVDYKLVFTPSVYVGEGFSNLKQTFYGLEEGTYEMILTDY